jgi:hypothetical protein
MSYIDPDQLNGAMTDLGIFITTNSAAITAKGLNPVTVGASVTTIQTDLAGKKGIRDQKKTDLATAQTNFAASATTNYTAFSDLIDTVAGAMGKQTPEGLQVLGYRKHLNAAPQTHASTPAPQAHIPA